MYVYASPLLSSYPPPPPLPSFLCSPSPLSSLCFPEESGLTQILSELMAKWYDGHILIYFHSCEIFY